MGDTIAAIATGAQVSAIGIIRISGEGTFAIVDRIFQGRSFTKQMMMTKDEVKREYKEMEGSAEIKQQQRQFRDEIMNSSDPVQAAKKSNVVVTNPTHLAVGIRYKADEAPLPRICALGSPRATVRVISAQ